MRKVITLHFLCSSQRKGGAEDINEFRPISLVSDLYKILAKVLAKRLKKVVGKVASKSHNAFREEMQILDVVLIAKEVVVSMLKSDACGIKLDIEKT